MVISSYEAWTILVTYGILTILLTIYFTRRAKLKTKEYYLVSNRSVKGNMAAFSIAATWIWAPALFVSAEKAYTEGIIGLFWFLAPNVATLIFFAFFAQKMRNIKPEGWSLSDYIREKYSNRVHNLFLVESLGLQTLSFAVQILAGAAIINKISGIDFFLLTITLALIPILYSLRDGIKASILTDYWQMFLILIALLLGLPMIISNTGFSTIFSGFGGVSSNFSNFFSDNGLKVFLNFGLPATIGLMSGPFGDQMFWQRVFSINKGEVKGSFIKGALIFGIVPLCLSIFGFALAGMNIQVQDTQLVNVESALRFASNWYLIPFLFMILSGLTSTVDSIICAVSSIVGHDIISRYENKSGKSISESKKIWLSRLSMIVVAAFAILIANISGMKILYLFLFYGTLRASVFLPAIYAIKDIKMNEKGLFYGIITSILVGLPIFGIGNINKDTLLIIMGSLITLLASGTISLIKMKTNEKNNFKNA